MDEIQLCGQGEEEKLVPENFSLVEFLRVDSVSMQKNIFRSKIFEYLNLIGATILIFAPILYAEIYLATNSDYGSHITWARDIFANLQNVPASVIAHASWQWLVLLTRQILNRTWNESAFVITLGSVIATSVMLFWLLRKKLSPLLSGALSLGLMVAAPVFLIDPFENIWYFVNGYIAPNVYHNPTILLLKPFAVLQFYYVIEAFKIEKTSWKTYILVIASSIIAVYTKPSFVICLLPALAIIALVCLLKRRTLDWKRLLFGIVLPSIVILTWQYFTTYGSESDSIILAPIKVMKYYSSNLLMKYILSIIFPLMVTIVYWKNAIKDKGVQLGWLLFGFGTVITYLFAETGQRAISGNFIWSGEITLFILFAAIVLFLADKNLPQTNPIKRWLVLFSGFLHVAFGLIYYFYLYFNL